MTNMEIDKALDDQLKRIHERYGSLSEFYREATRIEPPPNCVLKEISPNVFAWIKCSNDGDGDTTE